MYAFWPYVSKINRVYKKCQMRVITIFYLIRTCERKYSGDNLMVLSVHVYYGIVHCFC